MTSLHILVGSADRSVGNLVEALTRGAFRNQVVVKCRHVRLLEELVHEGESGAFSLVLCNAENLLDSHVRTEQVATLYQVLRGLCTIKAGHDLPIIAFGISDPKEIALMETGADCVLGLPFNCAAFQAQVQGLVTIPETSDTSFHTQPDQPHTELARAWQKLIHAFGFARPAVP